MESTLTNEELAALARKVIDRLHADMVDEGEECDCPLRRLSKEERAERIDKAIDRTTEEFKAGKKPNA